MSTDICASHSDDRIGSVCICRFHHPRHLVRADGLQSLLGHHLHSALDYVFSAWCGVPLAASQGLGAEPAAGHMPRLGQLPRLPQQVQDEAQLPGSPAKLRVPLADSRLLCRLAFPVPQ